MKQTKKRVWLKLDDGREFSVSGHDIAHHRASYYAKKDSDTTYESEYEFTADDDYELKDWLFGNMDWYEMPSLRAEQSLPRKLNECEVVESEVIEEEPKP